MDELLGRPVALKLLRQEHAGDPARRARFEQEARAVARVTHPNVVDIYDAGKDAGDAFIVNGSSCPERPSPAASVVARLIRLRWAHRSRRAVRPQCSKHPRLATIAANRASGCPNLPERTWRGQWAPSSRLVTTT